MMANLSGNELQYFIVLENNEKCVSAPWWCVSWHRIFCNYGGEFYVGLAEVGFELKMINYRY